MVRFSHNLAVIMCICSSSYSKTLWRLICFYLVPVKLGLGHFTAYVMKCTLRVLSSSSMEVFQRASCYWRKAVRTLVGTLQTKQLSVDKTGILFLAAKCRNNISIVNRQGCSATIFMIPSILNLMSILMLFFFFSLLVG